MRAMGRTVVIAVMAIALTGLASRAMACPVCFGNPDSAMTKGVSNGILVLLGVIGFVQIGFIALFWSFWRRARSLREARERFRLLQGGTR